jgi:hypothetical protein
MPTPTLREIGDGLPERRDHSLLKELCFRREVTKEGRFGHSGSFSQFCRVGAPIPAFREDFVGSVENPLAAQRPVCPSPSTSIDLEFDRG